MKRVKIITFGLAAIVLAGCTNNQSGKEDKVATANTDTTYVAGIDNWHAERIENLKKEDSWLALAGLYWLKPGVNTFGSAESNDIVFPKGTIDAQAGSFILDGNKVLLEANENANIELNGEAIKQQEVIFSPEMEQAPQLKHGSLSWVVIKRGDKYGVRLWDAESEGRRNFTSIERYPVQPEWNLEARLEQNALPKQVAITNVLGQTSQEPSPGAVVFTVNDQQYRLDALEEGEELFIIFADKTNGSETYGSGRYLYIPKPGADGKTTIDFNKAYNPPCAFTGFATCPLPPKQNFLPFKVTAGEKAHVAGH
ncbi:DUF1684 domain-containing protein [Pontibacter sp. MBLB2868]|uniref:DUF1684 domain-containing protein n=1 Tax=Pontibacter sp. MBLB2868 TaxID=3451555 RepID=UPI003F74DE0B